jgi:hypothetical protein
LSKISAAVGAGRRIGLLAGDRLQSGVDGRLETIERLENVVGWCAPEGLAGGWLTGWLGQIERKTWEPRTDIGHELTVGLEGGRIPGIGGAASPLQELGAEALDLIE